MKWIHKKTLSQIQLSFTDFVRLRNRLHTTFFSMQTYAKVIIFEQVVCLLRAPVDIPERTVGILTFTTPPEGIKGIVLYFVETFNKPIRTDYNTNQFTLIREWFYFQ